MTRTRWQWRSEYLTFAIPLIPTVLVLAAAALSIASAG